MRRFYLKRDEDVSGVSGTGRVAEGVEFDNGKVAMTWKSEFPSVTVYDSVTVVEKIHSHKGKDKTRLVWVDPKFEEVEEKAKETKTREKEEDDKELEEMEKKIPEEGKKESKDEEDYFTYSFVCRIFSDVMWQ